MKRRKSHVYIHLDITDFAQQMDNQILAMKHAGKLRSMDDKEGIKFLMKEGFSKLEAEEALKKLSNKQSSCFKELTLIEKRRALREKY